MARGRPLWQVAVTVGIVGGILSAAIGTIFRSLVAWLMPTMTPYSSPEGSELKAIRVVVEAVKGKEYARKVFVRPPAWKRALKSS